MDPVRNSFLMSMSCECAKDTHGAKVLRQCQGEAVHCGILWPIGSDPYRLPNSHIILIFGYIWQSCSFSVVGLWPDIDGYIIYRVNQSCLIVCHQSYIIHKYAEHVEQNAAWEAVSRLSRVSDNIRHVHAAHKQYTAITSWSWHGQVDFSYSGLSDHGFWLLLDCLSQFEACWA